MNFFTKATTLLPKRISKTIATKADAKLNHFDTKIFRSHKLKGKAKAMVVTKDIEYAIKYYRSLTRLTEEKGLQGQLQRCGCADVRRPGLHAGIRVKLVNAFFKKNKTGTSTKTVEEDEDATSS